MDLDGRPSATLIERALQMAVTQRQRLDSGLGYQTLAISEAAWSR